MSSSKGDTTTPTTDWSTAIRRRRSTYIMARSSIAIVDETRGKIFQYLNYTFAVIWFVFGIRDLFMCDIQVTNDPLERELYQMFTGCMDRPLEHSMWGLLGIWLLLGSFLRASVAAATDTSLLYHAMLFLSVNDFLLWAQLAMCYPLIPLYQMGLVTAVFAYQPYMTYLAYEAYSVRRRRKDTTAHDMVLTKTRTIIFQVVALLIVVASAPFVIRDMFFCGQPIPGIDEPGLSHFADCSDVFVKRALFAFAGTARLFFIAIRLYSAFVASSLESFNYSMLLNLSASAGQLLCLVRAQTNSAVFMLWVFAAVGLDATVYFESCLKMEEMEDEEDLHLMQSDKAKTS